MIKRALCRVSNILTCARSDRPPGRERCRPRPRLPIVFPLASALLSATLGATRPSAALHAQAVQRVISGRVIDGDDRPVPFVSVSVTTERATQRPAASVETRAARPGATQADDSGHFRLVVPHRERVVFDVRRVGYMQSRIALAAGGDTALTVLLLPAPANLPRIDVNDASVRPAGLAGFEQRMAERKRGAGAGWFITAKDIEATHPLRATQIVEAVPSMYVRRVNGDRFAIYARSGLGQECTATVYLDGVVIGGTSALTTARDKRGRTIVIRGGEDAPVDMLVEPSDIAGVEVYQRGIFAPHQLQPNDPDAKRCAIVAYWTKHGG